MTHPQSERWSGYLDGELPPAEARELDNHLEVCGECRRLLDELRSVVTRAGALEDRPPRADLWPRVSAHSSGSLQMASAAARSHPLAKTDRRWNKTRP